jgi:hypothetical protein
MREFIRTHITQKVVEDTIESSYEDIITISEDKIGKTVIAIIACYDNENRIVDQKRITITGEHYDLLMSESPEFSPNKPLNEYREVDLWYIIDLNFS